MFKMPSIGCHTGVESLAEVLHNFSNGFLREGSRDTLQCVIQPGNCFGFGAAYAKLPALSPKRDNLTD